jgi:hypothetical protein
MPTPERLRPPGGNHPLRKEPAARFWSRQDYYGFLNVFKYEREKVVLDKYTIVEPSRTRVIYNWLQYFSPETLIRELESGGLVVKHLLSDVAGTPFSETSQEMAIIARKP